MELEMHKERMIEKKDDEVTMKDKMQNEINTLKQKIQLKELINIQRT